MEHLLANSFANFQVLVGENIRLAYVLIYFGTILLGNLAAFSALWVAFQGEFGRFGVPLVMGTIFLGEVTADFLWYTMGRLLSHTRFGNFIRRHIPRMEKIDAHIQRNAAKWIFLAKFLYSSNFPILFAVGWAKIDFKRYFRTSVKAIAVWVPFIIGLVYLLFSTLSLVRAQSVAKRIEVVFLIGLIMFILANYAMKAVIQRLVRKKEL